MYANSEELHVIVWYWILYSVHKATEDLLLHLKIAKTEAYS